MDHLRLRQVFLAAPMLVLAVLMAGRATALGTDENLEKNPAVEKRTIVVEVDLGWKESGEFTGMGGSAVSKYFLCRETATVEARIYKVPRYYGNQAGYVIARGDFVFSPGPITATYKDSIVGVYPEVVHEKPDTGYIEGGGTPQAMKINIGYEGGVTVKNGAYMTEQGFRLGGEQGEIDNPISVEGIPYGELNRAAGCTKTIHQQKTVTVPVAAGSGSTTISVDGTIKLYFKK